MPAAMGLKLFVCVVLSMPMLLLASISPKAGGVDHDDPNVVAFSEAERPKQRDMEPEHQRGKGAGDPSQGPEVFIRGPKVTELNRMLHKIKEDTQKLKDSVGGEYAGQNGLEKSVLEEDMAKWESQAKVVHTNAGVLRTHATQALDKILRAHEDLSALSKNLYIGHKEAADQQAAYWTYTPVQIAHLKALGAQWFDFGSNATTVTTHKITSKNDHVNREAEVEIGRGDLQNHDLRQQRLKDKSAQEAAHINEMAAQARGA